MDSSRTRQRPVHGTPPEAVRLVVRVPVKAAVGAGWRHDVAGHHAQRRRQSRKVAGGELVPLAVRDGRADHDLVFCRIDGTRCTPAR